MKRMPVRHAKRRKPAARKSQELAVGWSAPTQFAVPIPPNEQHRLKRLADLCILDTPPESVFDGLAQLAAHICNMPIALISLVDEDRQWFKSRIGFDLAETPRAVAFCAHAIMRPDLFVVTDAREDSRFAGNPLVTGPRGVRFYAGAPLLTDDECALGTLCVMDRVPRELNANQRQALRLISQVVMTHLEVRRKLCRLEARLGRSGKAAPTITKTIRSARSPGQRIKQAGRQLKRS